MKKYVRRWSGLLLAALCLVMAVSASAAVTPEGEKAEPRYVTVSVFDAELSIDSNGRSTSVATVWVEASCSADITMELQQRNGSRWETIKTWSDSGHRVTLDHGWYVESGYTYRVKLSAEVTDSTGKVIERPVSYSDTVKY